MGMFQKDFTFITRMGVGTTTSFPIWNLSKYPNTFQFMLLPQKQKNAQERALRRQDHTQLNGTNQKKIESDMANKQENSGNRRNGLQRFVSFVKRNIKRLSNLLTGQNTAIEIAKLLPYGEEEVYNLTVPGVEHFTIENGIVVHNCADDLRYFLQTLREQVSPKKENVVQKKLRELKQKEEDFSFHYAKR